MKPLAIERLATLLWHAARTRRTSIGKEHRAAPSAGGLHATHTVVVGDRIELYNPIRHALGEIATDYDASFLLAQARELLPQASGTLLVIVGDRSRLDAAYTHAESLIWRDAGCAIALFQIVATWLSIACAPLGLLGKDFVKRIEPRGILSAAGILVVGESTVPTSV